LLDINNKRYFFTGGFVSNEVSLFKENMSIISASYGEHNLYSYINQEGKRVHPFYNFVRPFYEGLAYVSFLEEYYSLNNILSGYESVNQKKYDVLGIQHANFVDKSGFEVSKIRFERAYNFKDGFAAVQLDGKWGFLSKTGELAIPCIFDEVKSFSNEFAAARKDNLWGFINILGEVKIDFIYQNVSSFDNNHCCVQIENEWMIIDKKLNKICFSGNLEVDFINTFEYYAIENQFYGFISIFIKEKCISFKYFFYNKNNEAIISNLIPFGGFKDNILLVRSSEYYGSKFGYIDIFGNEYFLHKKDDKNNFYEQRYYANPKDAFDDDEQYIDWYENQ